MNKFWQKFEDGKVREKFRTIDEKGRRVLSEGRKMVKMAEIWTRWKLKSEIIGPLDVHTDRLSPHYIHGCEHPSCQTLNPRKYIFRKRWDARKRERESFFNIDISMSEKWYNRFVIRYYLSWNICLTNFNSLSHARNIILLSVKLNI